MSKQEKTAGKEPPARDTPFHIAFDLEHDVAAVGDYGNILILLAGTFEDKGDINSIARVGWDLIERSKKIEEKRMLIWRGLKAK